MSFAKDYLSLLQKRTNEYKISDNISRITTPLLDRNNDAIEIYVINNNNHITITDDGYIMNDLLSSGLSFNKGTLRHRYLNSILVNHGVELGANDSLLVKANAKNYAIKMHMLTQCMSKVSDLFVLNKPNIVSLFNEDIKEYLVENDIRFIENPLFVGKSRLTSQYDFAIPRNKEVPERIIKSTANIGLTFARTTLFGWQDTKETRGEDSELYLIFDDRNRKASEDVSMALDSYDIKLVEWSNINDYLDELSA